MTLFPSILVPLDGSRTAARSLGCATWLASRLGAKLHIVSVASGDLPAREELERLHVGEEHWPLVELHRAPADPEHAIMRTITHHDVRLVVMTARGASVDVAAEPVGVVSKLLGGVAEAVIQRCAVPLLLLPPAYQEVLPWERALVPISGGGESDEALVLAVRLAVALDLSVHVAHVADARVEDETLAAQARYSDAVHHEYRSRLEELVARALPALPRADCRRIESVALGSGDVSDELLRRIDLDRISVLVVGWHRKLGRGRARVLKSLIAGAHTPILFAGPATRAPFRLEVGEAFE